MMTIVVILHQRALHPAAYPHLKVLTLIVNHHLHQPVLVPLQKAVQILASTILVIPVLATITRLLHPQLNNGAAMVKKKLVYGK